MEIKGGRVLSVIDIPRQLSWYHRSINLIILNFFYQNLKKIKIKSRNNLILLIFNTIPILSRDIFITYKIFSRKRGGKKGMLVLRRDVLSIQDLGLDGINDG